VLNFKHAQRPWLLLPIGALYFGLYYAVFHVCIVRLNLATPGREVDDPMAQPAPTTPGTRAAAFVVALGGAANLTEVAACTTRLRLVLTDNKAVDEAALKRLGARGVIRSSSSGLQVVLGPIADQVAGEIRAAIRADATAAAAPKVASPSENRALPNTTALAAALGGRDNVLELAAMAGRVAIRTRRPNSIDATALESLGVRGIAYPDDNSVQLLVAGSANAWVDLLKP
jgi:PTS system N-acetylglucosamine-specific IIC component